MKSVNRIRENLGHLNEAEAPAKPPGFDVDAALKEVEEKTELQVQVETAYKWGSRAIACYKKYSETKALKWFVQALEYRHESLEHAALVEDDGKLLSEIQKEIDKHRGDGPQ